MNQNNTDEAVGAYLYIGRHKDRIGESEKKSNYLN